MNFIYILVLEYALLFITQFCTCIASYNATLGSATMAQANSGMAVAYDSVNDTVLLFGGEQYKQQFTTFKDNQFHTIDQLHLPYSQRTFSFSQHYSTLNDKLWMITHDGTGFITVDLRTYTPTNPGITIPTSVLEGGCLTTAPNYLMVIGGEWSSSDVQIYDINEGVWLSSVPTLLQKRNSFACLTINTNVYAIGGYSGSYLDTIETLDISNIASRTFGQWRTLDGTLQNKLAFVRAVSHGNNIIAIGGQGSSYPSTKDDVYLINTADESCELVGRLAFVTAYTSPIVIDNTLFIFGGWTGAQATDQYQYITLPVLPTSSPVVSPTTAPTLYPTLSPVSTVNPTAAPTKAPSSYPSVTPTFHPTLSPTPYPTLSSTLYTTYSPLVDTTTDPTVFPSDSPSLFTQESSTKNPTGRKYTTTDEQDVGQKHNKNNLMTWVLWTVAVVFVVFLSLVFCRMMRVLHLKRKTKMERNIANVQSAMEPKHPPDNPINVVHVGRNIRHDSEGVQNVMITDGIQTNEHIKAAMALKETRKQAKHGNNVRLSAHENEGLEMTEEGN